MENAQLVWWGYIHISGDIIAKRYYDREAIKDALESPFVNMVCPPFYAGSNADAKTAIKHKYMTHFEKLGKHFGYPECCVGWFTGRVFGNNPFPLTPEQTLVNGEQGFIPCPKCANKVASGEITIEGLITNREHPLPYPDVDRVYMDEVYDA